MNQTNEKWSNGNGELENMSNNSVEQSSNNDVKQSSYNGGKRKIPWWGWATIIFVILAGFGGGTDEGKESGSGDFGINVNEYIDNVEGAGVSNLVYVSKEEVNGGYGYIYKHGNSGRSIYVYTRKNGKVYQVLFIDDYFEHGVGQIGTGTINLAAEFFAATEAENQSNLYSAIYSAMTNGGEVTLNNCKVFYSKTMIKYGESAGIVAK